MSSNVDKVVKIYRSLSNIPALTSAFLANNNVINTVWSQRNLEKGQITKFAKAITVDANLTKQIESMPVDVSNESLSAISPSQKLRAVLRSSNEKQYLEVWQNHNLSKVVDLQALDLHGDVYTDSEFNTFTWSPDETKLLYIAELKPPKSEPFYKRAKQTKKIDEPQPNRGEEHVFVQDWGEQLVGKKKSVIAEYNLDTDEVVLLNGIPEDVCPAQIIYAPDGSYVVGIAYKTEPRKLGLIYCSNRLSTIFKFDFKGNYVPLLLENKSVKAPTFTPDGKYLLWLQRSAGGAHETCKSLMKATLPLNENSKAVAVVDVVKTEIQTNNGRKFYGLYNSSFSKRCFASGNRLVLSTNQKNTINTYIVDIESGKISELIYDEGSQIVLDVINDTILVSRRNYLKSDKLAIVKLPPKDVEENLNWIELTTSQTPNGLESCTYEYIDLVQNSNDSTKTFSAIYVGPKTGNEKSVNVILYPHGGPHSAFVNIMSLEGSLFLSLGFGIIYVNYRGSIGAGEGSVNFLLGRIGDSDVSDCLLSLDAIVNKKPFLNPNNVVLFGGSHGGFLVTYLSGKYPDKFKAVVARNPVIDVASMSVLSDIPDWCYVEAGEEYSQVGKPDENILLTMRKVSPIEHSHKVKAPTMLQIGSKDLRVPHHQGFEHYTRLKANGTKVRLNLYDDNHPLAQVPNEMDSLINSALWFLDNIEK